MYLFIDVKIGICFFENSFLLNFSFKMESLVIAEMDGASQS